ncbi:MAG: response regulator, partial [Nitrospirae bacterium]
MATARILSIDDSPTVLKLIEMIGQSAGYEVHVASDGARGVAMAAELHPDVILVDFIMPEMNGLQVCKALRDNPETRDIPVILVSSKGDAVGDKFVESLGVRHYCTKPFKADDLLAKLAEVLGERGSGAAAEEAAPSEATAGRERPLVLSIDDSPTILRLVEMILGNAGFEVRTAAGGAKGIELARSLKPDVVLVDFIMPEVNGFQVCKTLRGDPELGQVPIILVSSKGESVGEQFVNTLGIHHYLTKPFQPDQLVAEVRRALEAAGKGAAVKSEGAAGKAPPAA